MSNLSSTQASYLQALMWLVDPNIPNRCTGRTHTLAYAFMITAMENPGRDIELFDHRGHPSSINQIVREINLMSTDDEFKDKNFKLNIAQKTLTFVG